MHFQDTIAFVMRTERTRFFWTCCKCIYANCVMCVCFVCRWHQQDCRAPLSVLNLLGLALKLCCLAFFSTWSCREKAFSIFLIHYMFFFYSSIIALEVKKDLRPRLTQSRAWDIKVWQIIVSASRSCCSDNTGSARNPGLSEGLQSLSRRQNPSSGGKSHGAF